MNKDTRIGLILTLWVFAITLLMKAVDYFNFESIIPSFILGLIYLNLAMFIILSLVKMIKNNGLL